MRLGLILWALLMLILPVTQSAAGTLKVSLLPAYAPNLTNEKLESLASYLRQRTGLKLDTEIAPDFIQYEKRLKSGAVAVGYQSPAMYIQVSGTHEAIAMAVGKGDVKDRRRGIIVTMKSSGINTLEDLKGKNVSIASRLATYGYLSQKLTLKAAGINVEKDMMLAEAVDNKGENVILSLFAGEADAGFIHETALKEAEKYINVAPIRVVSVCAWLPNWALSVNKALPDEQKKKIQAAALEIPAGHPVLTALNLEKFRYSSDNDYQLVREAMEQ